MVQDNLLMIFKISIILLEKKNEDAESETNTMAELQFFFFHGGCYRLLDVF